jgi:hypothetical protein
MRRDGLWTGKAPTGYVNTVRDGKKWIDLEPTQSLAIKDAFSMYSSGTSTLMDIKKHWQNKYGLNTALSTIDKLLKNPFYCGVMRVNGKLYDHHYETLTTKAMFDLCENVRIGYKSKPNSTGGLPFAYKGLVRCADCGCLVTFETKKQKYTYGHCSQFKGKHGAMYLSESGFTSQFESVLKKIVVPDDVINKVLELINNDKAKQISEKEERMSTLKSEISRFENRMDRLYEDHLDGKMMIICMNEKLQSIKLQSQILKPNYLLSNFLKTIDLRLLLIC